MSRWLIWSGVVLTLVLAGVFVPQYGDYAGRAKMSEVVAALAGDRDAITRFYLEHKRLPKDAAEASLAPVPTKYIRARTYDASAAELRAVVQGIPGNEGKTVIMRAAIKDGQTGWRCFSHDIADRDLPPGCRKSQK
jgi:Tfp pilus assembly protein PilE